MSKEKINPQSPEEIAQAAQEAALKAAMEQAQAMFGGIPGFHSVARNDCSRISDFMEFLFKSRTEKKESESAVTDIHSNASKVLISG